MAKAFTRDTSPRSVEGLGGGGGGGGGGEAFHRRAGSETTSFTREKSPRDAGALSVAFEAEEAADPYYDDR
jgi:hypothetical protein